MRSTAALLLCLAAAACGARTLSSGDAGAGPLDAGADGAGPDLDEEQIALACGQCCSVAIGCEWRDDTVLGCGRACERFYHRVGREAFEAAMDVEGLGCHDEPHACSELDCGWLCTEQPTFLASCQHPCESVCAELKSGLHVRAECWSSLAALMDCLLAHPVDCDRDSTECKAEWSEWNLCTELG